MNEISISWSTHETRFTIHTRRVNIIIAYKVFSHLSSVCQQGGQALQFHSVHNKLLQFLIQVLKNVNFWFFPSFQNCLYSSSSLFTQIFSWEGWNILEWMCIHTCPIALVFVHVFQQILMDVFLKRRGIQWKCDKINQTSVEISWPLTYSNDEMHFDISTFQPIQDEIEINKTKMNRKKF